MCKSKYNPTVGMSFKEKRDYYVNKSIEKFGEFFDYSLIETLPLKKSPITIICPIHGQIETSFYKHLDSSFGCHDCGQENARNSKRLSFSNFIERLDEDINYKVLSKNFKGRRIKHEKIYVQDEFGICKVSVTSLLRGASPDIKSAICKNSYIINRFRKIHGFKYDYTKTEYTKALNYTKVTCRKHGDFKIKPNWHLQGQGCPDCHYEKESQRLSNTKEFIKKCVLRFDDDKEIFNKSVYTGAKEKILIFCKDCQEYYETLPNSYYSGNRCPECNKGGYSKSDYVRQSKNRDCVLYILKFFNSTETFYKIGITYQGIKLRFSKARRGSYNYKIIHKYVCDAGCAWDLEKELHAEYKKFQYFPIDSFQGYTECFTTDLPIEEIKKYLENI